MNSVQSTGNTGSMKKDSQYEELVASSPGGSRNWRGIFIALLVIAAVLGLIVFSIFLLSPVDEGQRIKGHRLVLSNISSNELKWNPFNGTWISDVELAFRDPTGGLSILNLENNSTEVLMENTTFRLLNADKFFISPDIQYVLLSHDKTDAGAKYHVYEVFTRNHFPLSPLDRATDASTLQRVLWAPNNVKSTIPQTLAQGLLTGGRGGNTKISQAIAFVYENDIFYKPKVQTDLVCRITTTGKANVIYNGIPDWLYSSTPELQSETLAFSPDGVYLSYISFNDTQVKEYNYTYVGDNFKYPEIRSIRYPKTSTVNPNVTVFVVKLSVLKFMFPQQIILPFQVKNGSYVGGMVWTSPFNLSVTFTNREQTSALTVLCTAPLFNCTEVHTETTQDNGWVLPAEAPIFSKIQSHVIQSPNKTVTTKVDTKLNQTNSNLNGTNEFEYGGGYLLKRLPVRDGEHGRYRHVVFISISDKRIFPVTMGRFEVTEILGWDEINGIVYFMAAPEPAPRQRHLYKINLKLHPIENSTRIYITSTPSVCLTCENSLATFQLFNETVYNQTNGNRSFIDLDPETYEIPNNCLFNKIYFSKTYSYYIQECLGPDTPSVYLVDTKTNLKTFVINNGDGLRNKLLTGALPQIRNFNVEIRHGFHAQVRLFLPPGMKEEEEVAFPLILQIDSSPGSQLVSEKYEVDWNWYLCSQKSYIIAQIDARGSGYQGELLRTQIKGRPGTVEIEDQLGVLTYLRNKLKFIDPTRICAYGWGYGGYAVSMTLIEDSHKVLTCGVAINPIVSFGLHNSFFTERYIPYSEDYLIALQDSDLSMRAGNIESRKYLVIHGTADTEVHPQHSLILAKSLIQEGVLFRHQVYTDEGHSLSGVFSHVYKTIENFFEESFGPPETNEWDPAGLFAFKQ